MEWLKLTCTPNQLTNTRTCIQNPTIQVAWCKPYLMALEIRLRRICLDDKSYSGNRKVLKEQLYKRGCKKSEVEKQLKKVDSLERDDLLNQIRVKEQRQDKVPLVLMYGGSLPNMHKILRRRANMLQNSQRLRQAFRQPPMVACRRGENLMDMLVHKKTNRIFGDSKRKGMQRCGRKRCAICKFVREMETLRTLESKVVRINQEITCQTRKVVYAASCIKCDQVIYIGETGTTLYQQTMNYLSSIRNNQHVTPLVKYFNENEHTIDDFRIMGVEIPRHNNVVYRRIREVIWVKTMKTTENGENKKQELRAIVKEIVWWKCSCGWLKWCTMVLRCDVAGIVD